MIEFCGEVSNECKRYMLKNHIKVGFCIAFICVIILSVPIVILGILLDPLILLFLVVVIVAGFLMPGINLKIISRYLPLKVIIENQTAEGETKTIIAIDGEHENSYASREISDVKKIIDMGEFYHIIFYFPHKSLYFVCQKNLITKGTLEKFEKLFEEKIIRKSIKN